MNTNLNIGYPPSGIIIITDIRKETHYFNINHIAKIDIEKQDDKYIIDIRLAQDKSSYVYVVEEYVGKRIEEQLDTLNKALIRTAELTDTLAFRKLERI